MGSREDKRIGGRSAEMESVPLKRYKNKADITHAILLTQENILEVATWCGGQLFDDINPRDDNDRKKGLKIPNMGGIITAFDGWYIIKNSAGRFEANTAEYFENKFELA